MEAFKKCEKVLGLLKKHPQSRSFLFPVAIPGYSNVIKEPMDLSTVEKKLQAGIYTSSHMFAGDIRKIWNNAWTYNQPGSAIYIATTNISDYFEGLMREVDNVQFMPSNKEEIQQLKKKVNKANEVLRKMTGPMQKTSATGSRKASERVMTPKEKSFVAQNIQKLSKENPLEILKILHNILDLPTSKNEVEFDLEKLSARKCKELDQAVRRALTSTDRSKVKKRKIDATPDNKTPKEIAITEQPKIQITKINTKEEDKKNDSLSNASK